jgi:hypothetical protein
MTNISCADLGIGWQRGHLRPRWPRAAAGVTGLVLVTGDRWFARHPIIEGMADGEPRTYRNWQVIVYYGLGAAAMALVSIFANPALWYLPPVFGALALVSARQHVIVYAADIEICKIVRRHRVPLDQVERLSVIYSRGIPFGWRIRLHTGTESIDTCSFLNLLDLRFVGATFAQPPGDAPAEIRELYALVVSRRDALVRARIAGTEPPAP